MSTPRLYVATSLYNAEQAKELISFYRSKGVEITYDWTEHGLIEDEDQLPEIGVLETEGVRTADCMFMVFPCRTGAHVELGIAIASGVPVVIYLQGGEEFKPFYFVKGVSKYYDFEAAKQAVLDILFKKE